MKNIPLLSLLLLLLTLSCSKKTECPDCQNGGSCDNGQCHCQGFWSGPDCTTQTNPNLVHISSISVTKFPATETSGAGWDLTSGPDVYVIVTQGGQEIFNSRAHFIQNATAGSLPFWNEDFFVPDPLAKVTIELWDYDDFDADDYMGGVITNIYTNTTGYPSTIPADCAGCNVGFRLNDVTYL